MNNNYVVSELSQILHPIFKKYDVNKAIIFGSVAKGTNTSKSDIDILVDSKLRGLKFVGLLEDVREAVDCDIDMFDYAHITPNSTIINEINNTGIVIYEK